MNEEEMIGYKSPITLSVIGNTQKIGVNTNREELEKVIYDGDQYGTKYNNEYFAGYEEGKREAVKEILRKVDYESNGQTIAITNTLRRQYGVEVEE